MNRALLAAAGLTGLSIVGYAAGTVEAYPGREASLVGLMVGVTLLAVTYGGRDGGGPAGGAAGEQANAAGEQANAAGGRTSAEAGRADGNGRANGGGRP